MDGTAKGTSYLNPFMTDYSAFAFPTLSTSFLSLQNMLDNYYEKKQCYEKQIYSLESENAKMFRHIKILEKRCKLTDITHSNTVNFVLNNHTNIKVVLVNLVAKYNNNLDFIDLIQEKIEMINVNIKTLNKYTSFP